MLNFIKINSKRPIDNSIAAKPKKKKVKENKDISSVTKLNITDKVYKIIQSTSALKSKLKKLFKLKNIEKKKIQKKRIKKFIQVNIKYL